MTADQTPAADFAAWIPAVLAEVAALGSLPEPPSPLTITGARQAIVNEPASRPRPRVEAFRRGGKVGIAFRWEGQSLTLGPGGHVIDCR